tara:strand:+ start:1025 stop:1225 length:201 start_codon:yes stop_codon:yes gene_type:complete
MYTLDRVAPGHQSHAYAPKVVRKSGKLTGEARRELLKPPTKQELMNEAIRRENLADLFRMIKEKAQ